MSVKQSIDAGFYGSNNGTTISGGVLFRTTNIEQLIISDTETPVLFQEIIQLNDKLTYNEVNGTFTNSTNSPLICIISYTVSVVPTNLNGYITSKIVFPGYYPSCGICTIEPVTGGHTDVNGTASVLLSPTQTFYINFFQNSGVDTILSTGSSSIQICVF